MKKVIEIIAFSTLIVLPFAACTNSNNSMASKNDTSQPTSEVPTQSTEKTTASINEIVNGYLSLKNALTADKTKEAATAGAALEATFKSFNKTALTAEQKKVFEDVEDDAREHAEHIGSNGGNIEHQREHFETLSKDIYALVKTFGAGQPMYQDFCPMYNDKKGAIWLSETKDIKNPYYGKKMLSCGSMKEELK
jgi:hypothetical protein